MTSDIHLILPGPSQQLLLRIQFKMSSRQESAVAAGVGQTKQLPRQVLQTSRHCICTEILLTKPETSMI